MTIANPPSTEQDEARLLSLVLTESSAAAAYTASRQMALSIGLTFLAGFLVANGFNVGIGVNIFVFGPLLVANLLWMRRALNLASAKAAVAKLPLWERHRVYLLLQGVERALKAKETK